MKMIGLCFACKIWQRIQTNTPSFCCSLARYSQADWPRLPPAAGCAGERRSRHQLRSAQIDFGIESSHCRETCQEAVRGTEEGHLYHAEGHHGSQGASFTAPRSSLASKAVRFQGSCLTFRICKHRMLAAIIMSRSLPAEGKEARSSADAKY